MDHLKRDTPDIMCIVETKLKPNIQVDWFGDGNYRMWRKDRVNKGGGGIIVLTRKDLIVQSVCLGGDNEEVVGVVVTDGRQYINIVTVYVPPKTSAWSNEQYNSMVERTMTRVMIEVTKTDKSVIVGDLNCEDVKWEEFEVGNGGDWGEQLLNYAVENLMTQWVRDEVMPRRDWT